MRNSQKGERTTFCSLGLLRRTLGTCFEGAILCYVPKPSFRFLNKWDFISSTKCCLGEEDFLHLNFHQEYIGERAKCNSADWSLARIFGLTALLLLSTTSTYWIHTGKGVSRGVLWGRTPRILPQHPKEHPSHQHRALHQGRADHLYIPKSQVIPSVMADRDLNALDFRYPVRSYVMPRGCITTGNSATALDKHSNLQAESVSIIKALFWLRQVCEIYQHQLAKMH